MLNTTDQWKKTLVALPDPLFFNIMRNYLGDLQTPFNKHSLIDTLTNFLLREETGSRVLGMIDKEDTIILTAIDFLGGGTVKELHEFFKSEKTFMSFHYLLTNLEERLLIYRESESGKIRISPVFYDLLNKNVFDIELLFPSSDRKDEKIPDIWFNDSLVTAIVSFICRIPGILKIDGDVKKKTEDEIRKIFPELLIKEKTGTRLTILLKGMINLSLIKLNLDEFVISAENLKGLSNLSSKQRYLLYAASVMPQGGLSASFHDLTDVIHMFIEALPEKKSYTAESLRKLLVLILKKLSTGKADAEYILDQLISLKILVEFEKRYAINPHFFEYLSGTEHSEPPIIIHPSFEITAKHWINLKDGIKFAATSEIKKFNLYPSYELNKSSYIRGHDCGMRSESVIDTLEKLNERPVPQNISVSIKSWEDEYSKVKVYQGTVLSISPDKRIIIEHLQNLQPYIIQKLTDGIYLMDSKKMEDWKEILENAGISVPGIQQNPTEPESLPDLFRAESVRESDIIRISNGDSPCGWGNPDFLGELDKRIAAIKLNAEEKEEFRARIAKKLILYPEQIQAGATRAEKTEATGMDYSGKVRLVERAIENRNELLEVTFGSPLDKLTVYLVNPLNLEKTDNDLLLNATTLPEETGIQFTIRKMSKVKRLKSSLYAPLGETPGQ